MTLVDVHQAWISPHIHDSRPKRRLHWEHVGFSEVDLEAGHTSGRRFRQLSLAWSEIPNSFQRAFRGDSLFDVRYYFGITVTQKQEQSRFVSC